MAHRRAWWRMKRWRFAAMLWLTLPIVYFLAEGPVAYASGYGGLLTAVHDLVYPQAISEAVEYCPPIAGLRSAYVASWESLPQPHVHDVWIGIEPF